MRIFVIEDDAETAEFLIKGLRECGHAVSHAADGRTGLLLAGSEPFDAIIVDRMLPGVDGLGIVKLLRGAGVTTPVLFLTAVGGIDDRVEGLEAGGDDYLLKPFAFAELLARLGAITRRPSAAKLEAILQVGDLEMHLLGRRVSRAGRNIVLHPREFQLLEYLMRNPGRVVTRTMLLENVWDYHFEPRTKIVETHISRLRAKLNAGVKEELIHTVRGSGYVIRAHP